MNDTTVLEIPTPPIDEQPVGTRLQEEAQLVSSLVMSALAVLHTTDSGTSLVGEFIGLVGLSGGIGVATLREAEDAHRVGLAKFFAEQLENVAKSFRRIENGESVDAVMVDATEEGLPLLGDVV